MASVILFLVNSCMYIAGAWDDCIPSNKEARGLDATDMQLSPLWQDWVTSSDHASSVTFVFSDTMSILQSRIETSQSKRVTEKQRERTRLSKQRSGQRRKQAAQDHQTQQKLPQYQGSESSDETYARRSFICVCVYIALTVAFAHKPAHTQTSQDVSKSSLRAREQQWDVAKAFCMFSVLCSHCQKPVGWPHNFFNALLRFEMPGFSFVSGIMAASGVLSTATPESIVLPNQKLLNRARDLLLANFTCGAATYVSYFLLFGKKAHLLPNQCYAFH
mmetsp:Transcript_13494/g.21271  ORF Transcript_13494/g.21271 Transcript_13494/m.21271 type:complete len:275 (+) Transcript_13494:108-932(+)